MASAAGGPDSKDEMGTPNTKLRTDLGVNSPRGKPGDSGFDIPDVEDQNNQPPPNFMTQVGRDGKPDVADSQDDDIMDAQKQATQKDSGCSCCTWLCGSNNSTSRGSANNAGGGATSDSKEVEVAPITVSDGAGASPNDEVVKEESIDVNEEESSEQDPEGLLPPRDLSKGKRKCLVLDLDETLVHSSFKPVPDADFIVPVEIDQVVYKVYVLKRPYVDEFLREVAKHYEVVIFTASLSKYANPLLDMLDLDQVIEHRLFREACVLHGRAYVKDMSKLGRKMSDIIIVDNSPLSYAFQPTSAIPIASWFDDRSDRQLQELLPVLCTTLKDCSDVRTILDANNKSYKWLCQQATGNPTTAAADEEY